MKSSTEQESELQMMTKAVAFLALLTVLLYLRALVSGGATTAGISGIGSSSLLLAMLFGAVALVVGWWWQAVGGAVALLTAVTVASLVYLVAESNQALAAFVYSSPFLVAGVLYLLCWWKAKHW